MDKPRIAEIETNVEAVLASYEKCEAGNCDGCAFEYIRRDWPPACAFYQRESGRYLLKKLVPKVMSKEDVQTWSSADPELRDPVFFEEFVTKKGWWITHDNDRIYLQAVMNGYGRCWTSRPADEQREAVKR